MEGIRLFYQQKDNITVEYYYHINTFNTVIDFHLMEWNSRFIEQTIELLTFNSALNLIGGFKSFKIDDICTLARKFYSRDFTRIKLDTLRIQLKHYEHVIVRHSEFQNIAPFLSYVKYWLKLKSPNTFS